MTDPLSAYIHRSWLVDADGGHPEGVNKVAIYYWDTIGLTWVKATGGAIPGANVNVTNFPANYTVLQGTSPWVDNISQWGGIATSLGQKTMASSVPVTLASDQSTVSAANATTLATDNTILTKSILTGAAVDGSGYVNVQTTTDGGIVINQNTVVDSANSTTTNLAGGATFVGPWIPDLNYTAVQYTIKADQNCTIYIEQSPDGTNPDISDVFNFFAPTGTGNTIQLVASYYRARITNTSPNTTTYLRFQIIKVPFVPSLPRSLDTEGHLQTHSFGFQDKRGVEQYLAPNGEVISIPLYKLVGDSFIQSTLDLGMWIPNIGTGGTVSCSGGHLKMLTGTTANNTVSCISIRSARFSGLAPNKTRQVVQFPDTGTLNNVRQWGVVDIAGLNGAFFELNGTTFRCVLRKAGTDTQINNGSFNGLWGLSFNVGTNSHFYEIIYQPRQVIFVADNIVIHTHSAAATPWSENLHLAAWLKNINSGGSTTNVEMYCRIATIARFGIPESAKITVFQAGLIAARILKYEPGVLHSATFSGIANNAQVIFYDNTAASGAIIFDTGVMPPNATPFTLDFGDGTFSIGLTIAVVGAACNVQVSFD